MGGGGGRGEGRCGVRSLFVCLSVCLLLLVVAAVVPVVTWSVDGMSVEVFELRNGESAILICSVLAKPEATPEAVSIFSGEEEMVDFTSNSTDILATVSPALNLSGIVYTCRATNGLGTGTDNVTFIVQGEWAGLLVGVASL